MLRAFESELIKLRRLWMMVGVFGTLLGFSVISTIVQFELADRVGPMLRTAGLQSRADLAATNGLARVVADSAPFGGVVVVVVVATSFATEYGWGTLRNLLVRQPHRINLLIGKFLAFLVFIFAARLVASAGSILTASIIAPIENIPNGAWFTAAGFSALSGSVLNLMLAAVGWASLGTLAATVLRAPGAAVGVVLALFPVEGLVSGWWDQGPRWLPGLLFQALAQGGSPQSSYQRTLALTMGFSLVAISASIWLFERSDITA